MIRNKNIVLQSHDLEKIRSTSIDYAVLEKENSIGVYPFNINWNDVGNWDSLSHGMQERFSLLGSHNELMNFISMLKA